MKSNAFVKVDVVWIVISLALPLDKGWDGFKFDLVVMVLIVVEVEAECGGQ